MKSSLKFRLHLTIIWDLTWKEEPFSPFRELLVDASSFTQILLNFHETSKTRESTNTSKVLLNWDSQLIFEFIY